ncbi:muconolactone Delta-isomerase family protein [Lacibacterium aquatile]|uniref:Muconolactone Delta-isomerase family protein n=1 Tax=Lacibacterium aquatile TaxID=1168082 RepID=A0ABW5DY33_9PROT
MQFFILIRRRVEALSPEEFEPWFPPEQERVREMYAEGFVRQIWRRGDMPGAVMLVEAADEAEVRAKLQTLPMLAANLLELVAVTPLEPYPAFGPRA